MISFPLPPKTRMIGSKMSTLRKIFCSFLTDSLSFLYSSALTSGIGKCNRSSNIRNNFIDSFIYFKSPHYLKSVDLLISELPLIFFLQEFGTCITSKSEKWRFISRVKTATGWLARVRRGHGVAAVGRILKKASRLLK